MPSPGSPPLAFPGVSPPQVIMERQEEPLLRHVPEEQELLLLRGVLGHTDQGQLFRPQHVELVSESHEEVFENRGKGLALWTGPSAEDSSTRRFSSRRLSSASGFRLHLILVAVVSDQNAAREEGCHGSSVYGAGNTGVGVGRHTGEGEGLEPSSWVPLAPGIRTSETRLAANPPVGQPQPGQH